MSYNPFPFQLTKQYFSVLFHNLLYELQWNCFPKQSTSKVSAKANNFVRFIAFPGVLSPVSFTLPESNPIQYFLFCAHTKVPHHSSRKYSKQQFQHSSEWPSGWQKLDPTVRFQLIKLAPNSAPEGISNGLPPANVYKANKSKKSDRTAAAADIARNDAGQEFDHSCSGGGKTLLVSYPHQGDSMIEAKVPAARQSESPHGTDKF